MRKMWKIVRRHNKIEKTDNVLFEELPRFRHILQND